MICVPTSFFLESQQYLLCWSLTLSLFEEKYVLLLNFEACLVQLLPSQKQFSTVPKAILAKNNVFGLAFQNCFYPPKAILHEATNPSF
jgi:hypothetical protein